MSRPTNLLAPTVLGLFTLVAATTTGTRAQAGEAASAPAAASLPDHIQEGTAELGAAAPGFTLKDLDGKPVHLSDFKGKRVVLEWFNPECPFVNFAHTKGPLKDMGNKYVAKGVVWLAVNSGGPGRQGYGAETNVKHVKEYGMKYPVLLDETGATGHLYGATNTPHLFIVDEKGMLVFKGGLDNAPFGERSGAPAGKDYVNYVELALADLEAGRPVKTPDARAYGCSVKYAQ